MLKVEKLSYAFPQKELYKNISFSIEDGEHCAFIGTNGTGKSTLIQLIMNPEEYLYDGRIRLEDNCRIGYVSQFTVMDAYEEQTVFNYICEPFEEQQKVIDTICSEMEKGENLDILMDDYQKAWDIFSSMDGDNYEVNIKKQLKIAGLEKIADTLLKNLSGGELKLVKIIREMLMMPGLLIMDEPDAFLDFENLIGLRELINGHKGTILAITHNRYLLHHCFNKILHLENTELQAFDGTYEEYHLLMLETKIEQMALAAADLEEIDRNRKIVERMRKDATAVSTATKGRTLHARVSLLERLEARQTKSPFIDVPHPEIVLHTECPINEEEIALAVVDCSIAFDEQLLDHVSFEMRAGEKAAIVGGNGTGKTSLLREIYANHCSNIILHPNAQMTYLSQVQGETLDEKQRIEDMMEAVGIMAHQAVDFLAPYGFDQEMLEQPISSLSGGEKNMLQLAMVSLGNANMLLLDEPTSHLDMYAQESLEQAVRDYNGTVLMVSHDFYTIANCVDYVLLVEDKKIRRVSARKFRKMIYASHFKQDYLEKDKKRKELEIRIYQSLKKRDYETAREDAKKLEMLIRDKGGF